MGLLPFIVTAWYSSSALVSFVPGFIAVVVLLCFASFAHRPTLPVACHFRVGCRCGALVPFLSVLSYQSLRVAWAQPPMPAAHLRCTQLKLHFVGADRARSGGVMTIEGFVKMVPHVPQPDPRSRFRCCLRAMRRFERRSPRSHRSHRRRYRKLLGTSEPQSCSPPRSPPNSNPSLKVPKTSRKLRCPQVISEGHGGSKSRKLTDLAGKRHLFYPCGKLPTAEIPTRSFPTRRRRRPRSPDPAQLSSAGTARISCHRTRRSQRCCCARCVHWHCGSRRLALARGSACAAHLRRRLQACPCASDVRGMRWAPECTPCVPFLRGMFAQ